jgi:hypothetical protein
VLYRNTPSRMPHHGVIWMLAAIVCYSAVLYGGWPYNYKFGFFLQTEGNLSRVNDIRYDARARLWDEVARCYACMKSHMGRYVPAPFGDRLSLLVTVLPSTWKPASSHMRPLHLETRMHARSHYM